MNPRPLGSAGAMALAESPRMTEQPNRQQLFEDLANARRELMRSLMYLSEQEAVQSSVNGDWSARDMISHVTARECTVFAAVQHLADDGDPHFPDPLDEQVFNRAAVQRRREFALHDVVDELDSIRRQIVRYTRKMLNPELYGEHSVRATGESKSLAHVLQELVEHDYRHASDMWRWRASAGVLHRAEFRYVITSQRNQFMNALGGLFEQDMMEVEVCGYWTAKDVMAHILSWDEEVLRTAVHWTEARPWQDEALYDDEWNEQEVAKRSRMGVVDLADGLATSHRHLVQFFDQATDEHLAAMSTAPWGERMSLVSFLYEMALHDGVHRPNLEGMRRRWR